MPSAVPCRPWEEARDIGDADGERSARKADAERGDQHLRIGMREGEQHGRHAAASMVSVKTSRPP